MTLLRYTLVIAFAVTCLTAASVWAEPASVPIANSDAAESVQAPSPPKGPLKELPLPAKQEWFKTLLKLIFVCIVILFAIMFLFSLRRSARFYKKWLGLGKRTSTYYIDAWKQYRLDDDHLDDPDTPEDSDSRNRSS